MLARRLLRYYGTKSKNLVHSLCYTNTGRREHVLIQCIWHFQQHFHVHSLCDAHTHTNTSSLKMNVVNHFVIRWNPVLIQYDLSPRLFSLSLSLSYSLTMPFLPLSFCKAEFSSFKIIVNANARD